MKDLRLAQIKNIQQAASIKNLSYDLKKAEGQYIHINAKNIGMLPKWHPNAGQNAMMYFDEIVVKSY